MQPVSLHQNLPQLHCRPSNCIDITPTKASNALYVMPRAGLALPAAQYKQASLLSSVSRTTHHAFLLLPVALDGLIALAVLPRHLGGPAPPLGVA